MGKSILARLLGIIFSTLFGWQLRKGYDIQILNAKSNCYLIVTGVGKLSAVK